MRAQVDEILDPAPPNKRTGRPSVLPTGHGGSRTGSGRKSAEEEQALAEMLQEGGYVSEKVAKARKENAQAQLAELDYLIRSGQYVSRVAVREATATAYATITQALRSIPDNLERQGVTPEIAQQVSDVIDEELADLAASFEQFAEDEPE